MINYDTRTNGFNGIYVLNFGCGTIPSLSLKEAKVYAKEIMNYWKEENPESETFVPMTVEEFPLGNLNNSWIKSRMCLETPICLSRHTLCPDGTWNVEEFI